MDDPDDDVILYLLPHASVGFRGAAFATAMPQNKSRFCAAPRSSPPKPHSVPGQQERAATADPVECSGLPKYEEELMTDAVAWVRVVQKHVTSHYHQRQDDDNDDGGELLYLLLDNMLVEDPDERSSADYCHDEAQKLLERLREN